MSYSSTIAQAERFGAGALEQLQQWKEEVENGEPPGYYFIGDNLDMRLKSRFQTSETADNDIHMYQLAAYKTRVPGTHLIGETKPIMEDIEFASLLPSPDVIESMKDNMAYHVAKVWGEFLPWVNEITCSMPKHIQHQYSAFTTRKTNRVRKCVLLYILLVQVPIPVGCENTCACTCSEVYVVSVYRLCLIVTHHLNVKLYSC